MSGDGYLISTVINQSPWPLHIRFQALGELEPQDDMTPKEAVCICAMLACAVTGGNIDYARYADEHALRRHFK